MSEQKICTKESPYNPQKKVEGETWRHPDAQSIDLEEYPGGDIKTYLLCPNCRILFKINPPE